MVAIIFHEKIFEFERYRQNDGLAINNNNFVHDSRQKSYLFSKIVSNCLTFGKNRKHFTIFQFSNKEMNIIVGTKSTFVFVCGI